MRSDKPYGENAFCRASLWRLGLAGFGLGVAVVSSLLCLAERDGRQQVIRLHQGLRAADVAPEPRLAHVRTLAGERRQMLFCLNGQRSAAFARLPRPTRRDLTSACLSRSQDILTRSPSRSLAHLVQADAFLRLGNLDAAVSALGLAQATGAREGWMGIVRLRIAFRMLDTSSLAPRHRDGLRDMARADLAVVANAPELADRLAVLFRQSDAQRGMMLAVIEQQPDPAQAGFVNAVARVQRGQAGR